MVAKVLISVLLTLGCGCQVMDETKIAWGGRYGAGVGFKPMEVVH